MGTLLGGGGGGGGGGGFFLKKFSDPLIELLVVNHQND